MSYDIFVQHLPPDAKSVDDISADFRPGPIGKRADIVAAIKEVAPSVDFSEPAWGHIQGDDWSIELNISQDEICSGFVFHVRGGTSAFMIVESILDRLGLGALDPQENEGLFRAGLRGRESFERWRAHRERMANEDKG